MSTEYNGSNSGALEHANAIANFKNALREATRASHHSIDHHPLLAPLVKPSLTLKHYHYVLQVMEWILVPIHARILEKLSEFAPDQNYRFGDRPAWLKEDLASLGFAKLPVPDVFAEWHGPTMTTPASLVGALYVIEGSALGGQVIARQLKNSIDVAPGQGASFFYGLGPDTMGHWGAYWQYAAGVCDCGDIVQICDASVSLFDDYERLFSMASQLQDNFHQKPTD